MEPDVNISVQPAPPKPLIRFRRPARARRSRERTPLPRPLTLAAMSLGYVVVQLDVTIVNVAINSVGADFGGSVADLQWIVNAYTITFAAFILTAGALGDRLGARRVFIARLCDFRVGVARLRAGAGLACLILARLCQGIGAAILVPNSLALLNHAYPHDSERHWAVGIWAAGASFSLIGGTVGRRRLIALSGWRSIFLINLPIGLAGIWLTWRYATETARLSARTLDIPGQMAAVLALGSSRRGDDRGRRSAAGVICSCLAALRVCRAGGALSRHRVRSKGPMLPLACSASPPSARCP